MNRIRPAIRLPNLSVLIGFCFSISCSPPDKPAIVLQREWTANAEFAGDLMASRIASKDGWELRVKQGSEGADPVQEVRNGRAHFGVASADRILKENELGAGLVVLAVASPKSPVVFLGQKTIRLTSPKDFIGKYVGIQSGTNTELVFDALVAIHGLDRKKIKVVESGWGVEEFVSGQLEILAAFEYDEPIQLRRRDFAFNTLYPIDHAVDFLGTVYFSRRELLSEDPETVRKFLQALLLGWERTFAAPEEALDLLLGSYKDLDIEKESLSLQIAERYFRGDRGILLYAERSRWEQMGNILVTMSYLKEFDFERNVDYSFLRSALRSHDRVDA